MNIGCHISIAKGIEKAPEVAGERGCEAIQIFTRSPSGGAVFSLFREKPTKFLKKNLERLRAELVRDIWGIINTLRNWNMTADIHISQYKPLHTNVRHSMLNII